MQTISRRGLLSGIALASVAFSISGAAGAQSGIDTALQAFDAGNGPEEKIEPYQDRFGRSRPVIAISALNAGSELADYATPFGILSKAGAADVFTVSTAEGPVTIRPLKILAENTVAQFDARFADGADYVIVPAVKDPKDPGLLGWIKAQAAKGATIVSICNGSIAVANAGLLDGHRATGHWGSEASRVTNFPAVKWQKNIRYVADGKVVSSSGISAAVPTSLALVEAIAGRARAVALAQELGAPDWSSHHDSEAFQPKSGEPAISMREEPPEGITIGIPVFDGIDEIALAFTADAYSMTGKATIFAVANSLQPVRTGQGLTVLPDRLIDGEPKLKTLLPALQAGPSIAALDKALAAISSSYGRPVAARVARIFEYPGFT